MRQNPVLRVRAKSAIVAAMISRQVLIARTTLGGLLGHQVGTRAR
ncbi:hypothetical protein CBM2615_A120209 [Cupriavidus taiwanensis]|uniref:Uncharacterized protein n=1 Tax=Cupriavidus taiwanensis TaxID=164546 RepID=A0A375J2U9_9BURK|nr:hypothetical protein CBM2615_A120209 [Cupriavidus taiwanensis]SOZ49939.1 hypothetical protein CBM2614_A120208 [Cupriavidus taiwanensis]SOZ52094.1 hypothetical protein CBM2613_A110210 [Cupriavidus taiwanensis]SPA07218.1 hypothetical protein CBM2625_A90207 [Cupriavidus taiwanensis]SPR99437.1 hypothetical protein CBM2634_A80369 [Cupriavidus taiwanensis]